MWLVVYPMVIRLGGGTGAQQRLGACPDALGLCSHLIERGLGPAQLPRRSWEATRNAGCAERWRNEALQLVLFDSVGRMRLSWNEIRVRAARFAAEWKDAHYEKGETQSFYNEFFEVFGLKRRRVASFEEPVKLLGTKRGFIDLFWKGVLLVEQKSAGRNLKKAKTQALEYFPGLKEAELPRYLLLGDFQTFELHDLDEDTVVRFPLTDLPKRVEDFAFILGVQKRTFRDQDPVNIDASELMGKLHDALGESGYTGHDLERFLVRLVFCLFADDTGIFEPQGIFEDIIQHRTAPDGSDLGAWLAHIFEVLNTTPLKV